MDERGDVPQTREKHPQGGFNPVAAGDPWAHRSDGMKCRTCMWFVPKAPHPAFGRCRRHAPTMSGYPAVFSTDWCGDHKLDEGKL